MKQAQRDGGKKPKVGVIVLGGTIVSRYDPEANCIHPTFSGKELLAGVRGIYEHFTICITEYCNVPGTQLTLDDALLLNQKIDGIMRDEDVTGVVVIQGTDTLEEIAYFISLVNPCERPVVFTGSMKSAGELYQDGPGNIYGAVQVASSRAARGKGVLVYMDECIYSAADVVKFHTGRTDSFQSFGGPLGAIENGRVVFRRIPVQQGVYRLSGLRQNVPLITCYAGMDTLLIDAALAANCDGLVIEALGAGNVHPVLVPALQKATARSIPVVIASRCFDGATYGSYDYEGGGAMLERMHVIFSGNLNGVKARIKLCVLLSAHVGAEAIAEAFVQ